MYDIIEAIIGHAWQSNYTSDQQYIYYICGAMILVMFTVILDLTYRVLRRIWR